MIALYVLVGLMVIAALIPAEDDGSDEASGTTTSIANESTTSEASETTTTAVEETTTTLPSRLPIFGDGIHEVGVDIDPGLYETGLLDDGFFGCYWARLSGFSGELDDIIANDNALVHSMVEIADTDVTFENACGDWYAVEALEELQDMIPEGRWGVNIHFNPGTYEAPGGDVCYWERLSGFSGELDDLIANDLPTGRVIVEIAESDVGFSSNDCGEWTKR